MVGAGTLEVDSRVGVDETSPERHAAAGKTRKAFDILYFGRAQRGDVVVGKIALIIEGARIAKISRPFELGGESDTLAVMKDRHGRDGRSLGVLFPNCTVGARTINAQAYAGVDGFGLSRCCLDLFGFEVNGLAHFFEGGGL